MAEFVTASADTPGGCVDRLREDIHIHAPYTIVRERLLEISKHPEWLSKHFRNYHASSESLAFELALLGRKEIGRLTLDGSDPFEVRFTRKNNEGEISEVNWNIHVETAQDSHLTVEAVFEPRLGLFGPILELVILRPQRTQALRDSIWNLKQLIEHEYRKQPIS